MIVRILLSCPTCINLVIFLKISILYFFCNILKYLKCHVDCITCSGLKIIQQLLLKAEFLEIRGMSNGSDKKILVRKVK